MRHIHCCRPGAPLVFPGGFGLFQQDNAPCHTAHIVREWFEEHDKELKVLSWPPKCPDLNLIEQLWNVLDQQVIDPRQLHLATYMYYMFQQ